MRQRIKYWLAGLVIAPTLAMSLTLSRALAEETANGDNKTTDATSIQDRITTRINNLKTKLTETEQKHLQTRCKAAQGNIMSLVTRTGEIKTKRSTIHENIIDKLNKIVTKLKAKNVDTTSLESQIKELQTKINTFNLDLATYTATVTDLSNMDCATDPTGFKASLETARTQRDTVAKDAAAIRTYLSETIKSELIRIKVALEKDKSTDQTN